MKKFTILTLALVSAVSVQNAYTMEGGEKSKTTESALIRSSKREMKKREEAIKRAERPFIRYTEEGEAEFLDALGRPLIKEGETVGDTVGVTVILDNRSTKKYHVTIENHHAPIPFEIAPGTEKRYSFRGVGKIQNAQVSLVPEGKLKYESRLEMISSGNDLVTTVKKIYTSEAPLTDQLEPEQEDGKLYLFQVRITLGKNGPTDLEIEGGLVA